VDDGYVNAHVSRGPYRPNADPNDGFSDPVQDLGKFLQKAREGQVLPPWWREETHDGLLLATAGSIVEPCDLLEEDRKGCGNDGRGKLNCLRALGNAVFGLPAWVVDPRHDHVEGRCVRL
jgi:hypothetical protein